MSNADKPAYPCEVNQDYIGVQTGGMSGITPGLSKREMFAMAAMQGMCGQCSDTAEIIERSIRIADELLKQLES